MLHPRTVHPPGVSRLSSWPLVWFPKGSPEPWPLQVGTMNRGQKEPVWPRPLSNLRARRGLTDFLQVFLCKKILTFFLNVTFRVPEAKEN